MSEFKQLVDFLEKKAVDINYRRKKNISKIEELLENKDCDSSSLKKHQELLDLIANLQLRMNNILKVLFDLTPMNLIGVHQPQSLTNDEYESFTDKLVLEIITNKIHFNNEHPLCGFLPFHNKLQQAYINKK